MKRRRDPLKAVVKLRSVREREARVELGKSLSDAREAAEQLERRIEEQEGLRPPDNRLRPAQLLSLHLRGIRSQELVDQAAQVMQATKDRLERSRSGWRRASARLDAAEELDRRRTEIRAQAAQRAAEKALDDLMMMRERRR